MAAPKMRIKGESCTANSTEDYLTVDSPVCNNLAGPRTVKSTRVELSKDEGVAVHVSEDANVLSDSSGTDSDADTDADSDVDSLTSPLESNLSGLFDSRSPHQKSISDLKKEKAELEEELKYKKEKVSALKLELARERAKHEKLVELKEVANRGGVVGTDDIDKILKE